jgi:hypothetical protein
VYVEANCVVQKRRRKNKRERKREKRGREKRKRQRKRQGKGKRKGQGCRGCQTWSDFIIIAVRTLMQLRGECSESLAKGEKPDNGLTIQTLLGRA